MFRLIVRPILAGLTALSLASPAWGLDETGQTGSTVSLGEVKAGDPKAAGGLSKRGSSEAGSGKASYASGDFAAAKPAVGVVGRRGTPDDAGGQSKGRIEEALAKAGDQKAAGGLAKHTRTNGAEGSLKKGDSTEAGGAYKH